MKCLEIARLQDFAPNTQGLLGALSGPLPNWTNPPLKISAYGPGSTTLMSPILLHLENKFSLLQKGFEIRKIIFCFLCNCVIRVVINQTTFNVLPAYLLNSSQLYYKSSHFEAYYSAVFKRAPSTFCKCTMGIIRYICSTPFASPFKLST